MPVGSRPVVAIMGTYIAMVTVLLADEKAPTAGDVQKIIVCKGHVLVREYKKKDGEIYCHSWSLAKSRTGPAVRVAWNASPLVSWTVAHGHCWFAEGEFYHRYQFAPLLEGSAVLRPGLPPDALA